MLLILSLLLGQVIAPPIDIKVVDKSTKGTEQLMVLDDRLSLPIKEMIKRYENPKSGQPWQITSFVITNIQSHMATAKVTVQGKMIPMLIIETTERDRPLELVPQIYVTEGNKYLMEKYGVPTSVSRCRDLWLTVKDGNFEWTGCQMIQFGLPQPGSPQSHLCIKVVVDANGKTSVTETKAN